MTTTEANQFVSDVLRGLWPRWSPNDEELRGWTDRLTRYDYGRAQKAVNDLFFNLTSNTIAPPAGKVFSVLTRHAKIRTPKRDNEPVLLFSLKKLRFVEDKKIPDWMFRHEYYVSDQSEVPAKEEILRRAESIQRKMNIDEPHVIIYPKKKEGNPDD